MGAETGISDHYTSGDLLERLQSALREDGVDPDHPTIAELAAYDQFHGRGLEATEELAAEIDLAPDNHLLDVGSGIGGPARYFAGRFGCRVTGIDLTEEFCQVARHLNAAMYLDQRITIENGNALDMPFGDETFDGAYSMNVSMNIADKDALYREIHRVLRPGGWLVLSEIARGPGPDLTYPTPWARTSASSFLATPDETSSRLKANGFKVAELRDNTRKVLDFGAKSRAIVERGEKAPHRAIQLIHGDIAKEATANSSAAVKDGSVIPIEVFCLKQ